MLTIDIAGTLMGIEPLYRRTERLCVPYIAQGEPAFHAAVTREEVDAEYELFARRADMNVPSDSELESMLLLRRIAEEMVDRGAFLLHGAAIVYGGAAYIFSAPSGTGKSTHVRRWLEALPEAYVLNGDKPFIRMEDTPTVCGSPWNGKERMGRKGTAPLKAVVFMRRAETNAVRPLSAAEAFPKLYRQVYRPGSAARQIRTLEMLRKLCEKTRFFGFEFNNFRENAFQVAFEGVTGKNLEQDNIHQKARE